MDIVERLREGKSAGGYWREKEAADEIERLQLREETLSGIIDGMTARFIEAQGAVEEIERLRKENELLQKELKKHLTYQDHRHGRIGTHDPICYEYGPRHYECALREIERLRDALRKIRDGSRDVEKSYADLQQEETE